MTNNINTIITHLLEEAETVTFIKEENNILYFDMIEGGEYGLQYTVKATPFYNDNEELTGYDFTFKEEGQNFYKGSGTLFLED